MQLSPKATHQQTRAINQGLVLRTIYDLGPISRAEVARLTSLTRTTVSDVVAGLLAEGLVEELGRGPSSGGKAPILVGVVADARLVIGLDLGEDEFAGALVDLRGTIRTRISTPVEGRDGAAALRAVERLVDQLIEAAPSRDCLLGIGVGTPGLVDTATGTIRWAVNLDWQDLELARILADRTGLPAHVANDSRAAAMGEHLFDLDRHAPNLVAIKIGNGIGAGIVVGGELFQGDGFGAGEIGHTTVVEDGAACRCGRFGCLETVASSRAIVAAATQAATDDPDGPLGRALDAARTAGDELSIEAVAAAVDAGDEVARRIAVAAGRRLGASVAGLIGTLDIHHVVLLGTVTHLGGPWLDAVRDEAGRRALGLLTREMRIDVGGPAEDVVLLGASALLLARELGLVPARTAGMVAAR